MTTLEQKAREAAIDHGMWLAPDDDETNYQAFVAGYLRGHSDMAADTTNALDELEDWRESARKAIEEPCGDEKHCSCVGPMRRQLVRQAQRIVEDDEEVAALRARVAELEGMVPKWARGLERYKLEKLGWLVAGGEMIWHRSPGDVEASWHVLVVPPIPLPEGTEGK